MAGNGGPPEGKTQQVEAAAAAQLAGVLHSLLSGVSASLGVSVIELIMAIMCGLQRLLEARQHRERGGRPSVRGTAMVVGIAVDLLIKQLLGRHQNGE